MNRSMRMGLIALIGIVLVFYQYHLLIGVRLDQETDFNEAAPPEDATKLPLPKAENTLVSPKLTENMIRMAVNRVQKAYGLGPEISSTLVKELINNLNRNGPKSPEATRTTTEASSPKTVVTCPSLSVAQNETLDPLYIITPTYRRPEQIPELTRMSHTLMLVRNVRWLVIEDANVATKQVTELLERTGLKYEHLIAPMPEKYKLKKGAKPRGVSNRNRGLEWIRANATDGVFYFADDDNTYDIALFDEIRRTKKVSMFPVGLCTKFGLSSPIIENGKFAGFYDGWVAGRKFPVDMAGFAVSVKFLHQRPNATMPFRAGFEEDGFLKSLAPFEPKEIEPLADNCTRILAWHTQTKKNEPSVPLNTKLYGSTNLVKLKQQIV